MQIPPLEHDLEAGRDISTSSGSIRPERTTSRHRDMQDESEGMPSGNEAGAGGSGIATEAGVGTGEDNGQTQNVVKGKRKESDRADEEDPAYNN